VRPAPTGLVPGFRFRSLFRVLAPSARCEGGRNIEQAREVASKALQHLSESLAQGESESEVLRNYLAAMGKLHRYGVSNILLIMTQRQEATRVAGYQTWRKLHRQVTRGAKGIVIFAPLVQRSVDSNDCGIEFERQKLVGYRAAVVFDVADTAGNPLPSLTQFEGNPGEYLERLKSLVTQAGCALEYSTRFFRRTDNGQPEKSSCCRTWLPPRSSM
jgi:hypothetical protein